MIILWGKSSGIILKLCFVEHVVLEPRVLTYYQSITLATESKDVGKFHSTQFHLKWPFKVGFCIFKCITSIIIGDFHFIPIFFKGIRGVRVAAQQLIISFTPKRVDYFDDIH